MQPANVKCPFCRRQLKDEPRPQVVTGHWIEDENLAMSDSDSDLLSLEDLPSDEDEDDGPLPPRFMQRMQRILDRQITLRDALQFVELGEMEDSEQQVRALQQRNLTIREFFQQFIGLELP